MFAFLSILIIIVSLFITLIVLIQDPKGGGLTGGLGTAASSVIGVQSAGNIMEKTTWGSAIVLFVLCVLTAFVVPKVGGENKQIKTLTEQAAGMKTPVAPAPQQQNKQPEQDAPANPLAPTGK